MIFRLYISVLILFLTTESAFAYLDPGTGSIILQAIIGGLAACAYTIKMYWVKIKSFFYRNKETKEETAKEATSENTDK